MRKATLLGLISTGAFGLMICAASAAQAQQPRGSFEQSCRNIGVSGGLLSAECTDMRGRQQTSTIPYRQCVGDIGNNNGILVCNGATATLGQPGYGQPGYGQPGYGQPGYGQPGPQGWQDRLAPQNPGGCYPGEHPYDCQQRLGVQRRTHHNYVWRNGQYEDENAAGATVAAGIIGFILDAAIVGSSSDRDYYNAHRYDRGWRNRCRSAYSSFDYNTGTYRGQDGYRHYCTR